MMKWSILRSLMPNSSHYCCCCCEIRAKFQPQRQGKASVSQGLSQRLLNSPPLESLSVPQQRSPMLNQMLWSSPLALAFHHRQARSRPAGVHVRFSAFTASQCLGQIVPRGPASPRQSTDHRPNRSKVIRPHGPALTTKSPRASGKSSHVPSLRLPKRVTTARGQGPICGSRQARAHRPSFSSRR